MKVVQTKNYSIYLGDNVLQKLQLNTYSKAAILVDENTKRDCLHILLSAQPKLKSALIIQIESGEKNKNILQCQAIWEELGQANFDRKSVLINLGGGVIGDLGGFAASCYKRGIDFIQIPTSLLAMVDASIGGKLGFDFNNLKNQIGLFNDPQSVHINPGFLKTLDQRQLKSGFAEIVKHALIADQKYWNILLNLEFRDADWHNIILTSLEIKNEIVKTDPKEQNIRKTLNFGHTIGHAVESYYLNKNQEVSHGEAITLGMIIESKMSDLPKEKKQEIENYMKANFNVPKLPALSDLKQWIIQDKKNEDGKIQFSLLQDVGSCLFNQARTIEELNEYF